MKADTGTCSTLYPCRTICMTSKPPIFLVLILREFPLDSRHGTPTDIDLEGSTSCDVTVLPNAGVDFPTSLFTVLSVRGVTINRVEEVGRRRVSFSLT